MKLIKTVTQQTRYVFILLLLLTLSTLSSQAAPASIGFVVDSMADGEDVNHGDGTCADSNGDCTFRAAIEELNATGIQATPHQITFNLTLSSGTYATLFPATQLMAFTSGTAAAATSCAATTSASMSAAQRGLPMGVRESM